ncbi:MAG: hypothetical protein E7Z68_02780 [Thermoplasmata archaeon]|jgi:hypothetical protein|nr:hypothetical protein [Thermoplasmata archaeon]
MGRVKAFVGSHDKIFLRELAYRILDSMDDKLKKVFVAEKYDNADWMAAATLLFPLEMSKQVSFVTYTGSPDRCFQKLAGLFDTDDLTPTVSLFAISVRDPKESARDELFDSYVDNAYSEGSDRQAFFDFLSRVGWKDIGKGVIDAYHMFAVCEKGVVPPESARLRCLDALKQTMVSAKDDDIASVYNVVKDRMDPAMADFFGSVAVPRMKDRTTAERILAEVTAYTLEPSRSLGVGSEVVENYSRYKDPVLRCVDLGALDLIDYPAARYYCYKAWSESKDSKMADIISGYGPLDDLFIDASCSDGRSCIEALDKLCPLSDAAKGSIKDGIVSRAGSLPSALLNDVYGFGLTEDKELADRLSEAVSQRDDRQAMERSFVDVAIEKGDNTAATSLAKKIADSCMESNGDIASTIRFIGQRASSLDWKCSASLITALSKSIDFTGFGPLPAVREALAAFPDMEGMVTSEEASRIRLLDMADRVTKDSTMVDPMDVSSLSAEDREAFVKLCMGKTIPRKGGDKWVSDRLKLFSGCPEEAARRMGTIVSQSVLDKLDAEMVAAFIVSAKENGASDESVYANLKLDGKQASKVRKLLKDDILEAFNSHFKEGDAGSHKGLFSKPSEESEKKDDKPESKPKKGGLLGLFRR